MHQFVPCKFEVMLALTVLIDGHDSSLYFDQEAYTVLMKHVCLLFTALARPEHEWEHGYRGWETNFIFE